LISHGTDG